MRATSQWMGRGASVLTEMRGRRFHRRRTRGRFRVIASLSASMVVFVGLAALLTSLAVLVVPVARDLSATTREAATRMAGVRLAHTRLRRFVTFASSTSPPAYYADPAAEAAAARNALLAALSELEQVQSRLWQGGSNAAGTVLSIADGALSSSHLELEASDACAFLADVEQRAGCRASSFGVLTTGLAHAVQHVVNQAHEVMLRMDEGASLDAAWSWQVLVSLSELERDYMAPLLEEATGMYVADMERRVAVHQLSIWLSLGLAAAAQLALYVGLARPALHKLEAELRHARTMLFMVPGDVARQIPSIRAFVRNYTLKKRLRGRRQRFAGMHAAGPGVRGRARAAGASASKSRAGRQAANAFAAISRMAPSGSGSYSDSRTRSGQYRVGS